MTKWIDLNLPFKCYNYERPEFPPVPDLSVRAETALGSTIKEEEQKAFPGLKEDESYLDHPNHDEYWYAGSEALRDVGRERKARDTYLRELNKPVINKVLDYYDFLTRYNAWLDEQPEMIEWNKQCDEITKADDMVQNTKSFCGRGLNKAGVLIEIEDRSGKITQYLIGNINTLGGTCDDCHIDEESVVKRYAVVWEKGQ
jgi:hypothetical protein